MKTTPDRDLNPSITYSRGSSVPLVYIESYLVNVLEE